MKEKVFVDTNVIIRFLLNDHPRLSPLAKSIFFHAEHDAKNDANLNEHDGPSRWVALAA